MQPLDGSESLVIDCSVTMAWYFKDEATPYSNAVRAALVTERAAVPALWPLEVANVLLMGERRKRSTQAKATKWLRFLAALPIAVDTQTPALGSTRSLPWPAATSSPPTMRLISNWPCDSACRSPPVTMPSKRRPRPLVFLSSPHQAHHDKACIAAYPETQSRRTHRHTAARRAGLRPADHRHYSVLE